VLFDYDTAGNQIRRYAISISARTANNDSIKDIKDLVEEDLLKSDIYEDIKYFPNPVSEELFVNWVMPKNKFVERVDLYSITGQLLTSKSKLAKENTVSIQFSRYPEGMYNLVLLYSNGEQKTLKVIKK
jgi:hypothetical protein